MKKPTFEEQRQMIIDADWLDKTQKALELDLVDMMERNENKVQTPDEKVVSGILELTSIYLKHYPDINLQQVMKNVKKEKPNFNLL